MHAGSGMMEARPDSLYDWIRMKTAMHRYGCRPQDHPRIGRRDLLEVGGMTLVGTGLADLLRLESAGVETDRSAKATAKSVVFIFQSGGPSQHETVDPKPESQETIRG